MDTDVVVVGAGLAGLRCAARLTELGHEVVVLEEGDSVGGRVRTDVVDGFRCDRGFQVLGPAYPAVRRWVDVAALDLKPFGAGVLVRRPEGLRVVADPVREPALLGRTLRSGYLAPRELAALARWAARVLVDPKGVMRQADSTLAESFDAAGVTGRLRREVLEPFLAGVLVDSHGRTSANFTKLLVRMFALGRPAVPATGMQALPEQLAAPLGDRVRLGSRVEAVTPSPGGVDVRVNGARVRARSVVVATDPAGASGLTMLPEPVTRGLVTWWFEAPEPPTRLPLVAVDGRREGTTPPGPVWNTAVMTAAAPSYAPPTRHLVEATCLLDRPDGDAPESVVLRHVGDIYGADTSGWRTVTRHRITAALPATPPPLDPRSPVSLGDGVFVCGDHRDTASIQGALVSGQRAAEAVHAQL
ncbi:NAD(P)/FAD-dependent oxidoreductase [Terrabacter sp. NPDC080008]|uniref:NAD(P)/FAD-dependent oxidoreductase n=1 Tax=Terrabacter sp. NPDC080008 TaxID=3155176 RepID=UPI00344CE50D